MRKDRAGLSWVAAQSLAYASPVIAVVALWQAYISRRGSFDLIQTYLPAAHDLLHGRSPYHLAQVAADTAYVCPPLPAYLAAPFALLPAGAIPAVGMALGLVTTVLTLALVGVRDRRCYFVALGSPVVFYAVEYANPCLLTALGAAVIWRYRDRGIVVAVATGIVVAIKIFMWPLLLVPLLGGRMRTAAAAGGATAAAILLPWAAIGLAGLRGYPHLLSSLTARERGYSYSIATLVARGASWRLGEATVFVLGAAIVVWMIRHRRDERQLFVAALGLSLLTTPVIWPDYFSLLYVALAVSRRAFGYLWAAPLLLWATPVVGTGSTWQLAITLSTVAATWVAVARGPGRAEVDRADSRSQRTATISSISTARS